MSSNSPQKAFKGSAEFIQQHNIHQKVEPTVKHSTESNRNQQNQNYSQFVSSLMSTDWSHIVWENIIILIYLHIVGVYGMYLLFTAAKVQTILWTIFTAECSTLGVTCGAHRLWSHQSYKATLPFKLILAFWQTVAVQVSIFEWARDHRVHHKHTDTNADPYSSARGFFFSHVGWVLTKKHKDVISKGKTIDLSDLKADPVVMFQRKYFRILAPLLGLAFPAVVPWYFWNESWTVCWCTCAVFRYVVSLHQIFCINSVCHKFGTKPFDKSITPVENLAVGIFACGEGWHNYHHVFPWDYQAAEFGAYGANFSVAVIDLMAKIGWAYDLKTVSVDIIAKRATRTGDGSRKYENVLNKLYEDHHERNDSNIWGWDDKDMTEDERQITDISHISCD